MRAEAGDITDRSWRVLVILGASGTGKSTAAKAIARRYGMPWLQVDNLRLAIESMDVTLPEGTDRLYFFLRQPDVWRRPADELRQALIDVADLLMPAVRIVLANHLAIAEPIVLEGDGVHPALAADPMLRPRIASGELRFCCVAEESEDRVLENMRSRGRGMDAGDSADHPRQAEVYRDYGAWLAGQCEGRGIPVVASRPFETLPERILTAVAHGQTTGGASL